MMSPSWVATSSRPKGLSFEPPHPPPAPELGEQRPHRVAAVQLVGAVGDHGQQPGVVGEAGGEEREEVASRVVGPVGVVEPEHHRPFLGHRFEQGEERLEGTVAVAVVGRRRVRVDLRDQLGEPGAGGGGEAVEDAVVLADQAAQGGDQRRVGQFVVAELDALAADRAAAAFAGAVEEGVEQAGLANARLARQERQRGRPGGGLVERGLQLGELGGSADQAACADSGRHPAIIAVPAEPG